MAKYRNEMARLVLALKALADESRLRVFYALRDRELCVCQIVEFLELAPSTVSKHMSILKQAGLVESRKDGRWIYYRLPEGQGRGVLAELQRLVGQVLSSDKQGDVDCRRIESIARSNLEDLCRQQRRK